MIGIPADLALASEPLMASAFGTETARPSTFWEIAASISCASFCGSLFDGTPDELDALVLGRLLGALLDHRPERALVAVGDHRERQAAALREVDVRCPAAGRRAGLLVPGRVLVVVPTAARRDERAEHQQRSQQAAHETLHVRDTSLLGARGGQELDALLHIERRAALHRGLRPGDGDVLLEHEPAPVPGLIEEADDLVDPRVPVSQRPEQALLHGLYQRQLAGADLRRQHGVHVLEVDVGDAVRVAPDEALRLDPPDQQVAGVEHPPGVGDRERAVDVGGGLDERPDVRVDQQLEPVTGRELGHRGVVRAHARPALVVELDPGRPVLVDDDRRVDDARRPPRRAATATRSRCSRVGARSGLVEHERDEAADEAQAVAVELGAHLRAVERQPAERAELRRAQAELGHLAQDTPGVELPPPPGDLADAPRDRGRRQPGHEPGRLVLLVQRSPSPPRPALVRALQAGP